MFKSDLFILRYRETLSTLKSYKQIVELYIQIIMMCQYKGHPMLVLEINRLIPFQEFN